VTAAVLAAAQPAAVPDVPFAVLVLVIGAVVVIGFVLYRRRRPKDVSAEREL